MVSGPTAKQLRCRFTVLDDGDQEMLIKGFSVGVVALLAGTSALAQEYFDFGRIQGVPEQPAVQVDLNPMLLGFAGNSARDLDPQIAGLLSSLDGVRIRVYNTIEDIDDVAKYVNDTSEQLTRAGWQQIVSVQEEGNIRIFLQGDEQFVTGLTGMIVSESEAIFVNVVGSISSEQVGQLAARAGAGELMGALGGINLDGLDLANLQ